MSHDSEAEQEVSRRSGSAWLKDQALRFLQLSVARRSVDGEREGEERGGGGAAGTREGDGTGDRGAGRGLQAEEACQISAGAKNKTDWACVCRTCWAHTHTNTKAYAGHINR